MEEEIDLRELMQTLWDGRRLVAGVTAAAVLISGAVSFFVLPPVYESTAIVAVQQAELPEIPGVNSPLVNILDDETLNVADAVEAFRQDLGTQRAARAANEALGLPEGEMTASKLQGLVTVERQNEESIQVSLVARQPTSDGASDLASWAVNRFQEMVGNNNLNVILSRLATLSAQLDTQIKSGRENVASLEEQLSNVPQYIELQETIVDNPLLQQGEALRSGNSVQESSGLSAVRQYLNPTYEVYQQRLDNTRADLTEVESLKGQVEALFQDEEGLRQLAARSGSQARVVAAPNHPEEPVSPRKMLNMAVALVLGGMLGVFWVFFRKFLQGDSSTVAEAATRGVSKVSG